MSGVYNTKINQGASFYRKIKWNDANNNPINLTNYTIRAKLKRNVTDHFELVSFTIVKLNQTTDTGWFEMSLTAAQTSKLPTGVLVGQGRPKLDLYYDIEAEDDMNFVTRILEGVMTCSPEVTK